MSWYFSPDGNSPRTEDLRECQNCSNKVTCEHEREDFNYAFLCDDCYSEAIQSPNYEPSFHGRVVDRIYHFSDRQEARNFTQYWL